MSLVSKCVSIVSALQHLGKYIAMEQVRDFRPTIRIHALR